ncbi:MAG: Protein kinase [candidate division TM6 bacterium GW2011_GWE2_36_25]|nr:MAG: Protein kinase [candidate division TM6 bacterium GW2011_GWF2_36_131]KKQ02698.1 MAG: Protein kinase [candidate division TM6 bacterium GW2011_GWE2_36_25]KKQ19585.1 MAG: Protein kinase [candidate division TM6 bacterium GW2011_GWA2_36_9]
MKKLLFIFLILGLSSVLGMEPEGEREFQEGRHCMTINIKEPIKLFTSDGVEVEFSPSEVRRLDSRMLNDLLGEFGEKLDEAIPLKDIDVATLTIIKNILEKGLDKTLSSYKDDWSYLIDALEFLGATKLLDDVCTWVAKNCDLTKFDSTNMFSTFIKQRRVCYPLQKALARRLCSTECALKTVCKNPIILERYAWFSVVAPDNSFIVTASANNTVKIWRLNEEREVVGEPIILAGHTGMIYSLAIAKDNAFIVTGSSDRTAKIWRLDENLELAGEPITLSEHTRAIGSVAIAKDNSFIVTGSGDRTAKIWRLNKDHEPVGEPITLVGHTQPILSAKIATDNAFIVTTSFDGTARIWRLNEDHEPAGEPIILREQFAIRSVAIASDNSFIVIGAEEGTFFQRLSKNHTLAFWPIRLRGHDSKAHAVIAADNSFIVTSATGYRDDAPAKIWRLDKNHELAGEPITLRGLSTPITSVAIAADSSFIVIGSGDRTAKIWRLNEDHKPVGEPIKLTDYTPTGIASDNSFIVTGLKYGAVKIWRNLTISDVSELDLAQTLVLLKLVTSPSEIIYATPDFYAIYESLPKNDSRLAQFCTAIKQGKSIEKMSSIGMAIWFAYKNFMTRAIHETPATYDSLPENLKRIVDE